jgi:SagB-type dehydrogenase family enzyme
MRLKTWLLLAGTLVSCTTPISHPEQTFPTTEAPMTEIIKLPHPALEGPISLEEAMQNRRSIRSFTDETLSEVEISQLLWAAQGLSDPRGYRTAPSAGALYPLELYVVMEDGVYHYDVKQHALELSLKGDLRREVYAAGLRQEALLEAPVTIVIAAVYERIAVKYGRDRGPRYVHMEVGHAAQNVLLQAVTLGLGSVPIGAFEDARLQSILDLPPDHQPLYLIPVGHPR